MAGLSLSPKASRPSRGNTSPFCTSIRGFTEGPGGSRHAGIFPRQPAFSSSNNATDRGSRRYQRPPRAARRIELLGISKPAGADLTASPGRSKSEEPQCRSARSDRCRPHIVMATVVCEHCSSMEQSRFKRQTSAKHVSHHQEVRSSTPRPKTAEYLADISETESTNGPTAASKRLGRRHAKLRTEVGRISIMYEARALDPKSDTLVQITAHSFRFLCNAGGPRSASKRLLT